MLGMPYLLLGVGGGLIYRRYRNYENPPPQDPAA